MIQITPELISPDLSQKIKNLDEEIQVFRGSPLDKIALEKLREHFRTHHIYHSAGIEGNRLTLQETALVLKEGIDISGKPLKDSVEVKNLGTAFDFLYELAEMDSPISEHDIKQVHAIVVGHDTSLDPGNYRNIGVIISGSEHTPPEPFEVPIQMQELFEWINENIDVNNALIVAAIAHHEFVKIHPFKDGNGRTARILLNLILLKKGYPISNIRRDERPIYYEALGLADEGNYEPIIEVITQNSIKLFSEYTRVKDESNRLKSWALKLGNKDTQLRLAKLKTEFDLWLNKISQIKLEFKQATNILNENLESYYISFYEYSTITFEKYQQLKENGIAAGTNFFSIRIHNNDTDRIVQTFMFRFHRFDSKFPKQPHVIPMELNFFNESKDEFDFIGNYSKSDRIHLRSFYLNDKGEISVRKVNPNDTINANYEHDFENANVQDEVMTFFEQVCESILGIR